MADMLSNMFPHHQGDLPFSLDADQNPDFGPQLINFVNEQLAADHAFVSLADLYEYIVLNRWRFLSGGDSVDDQLIWLSGAKAEN